MYLNSVKLTFWRHTSRMSIDWTCVFKIQTVSHIHTNEWWKQEESICSLTFSLWFILYMLCVYLICNAIIYRYSLPLYTNIFLSYVINPGGRVLNLCPSEVHWIKIWKRLHSDYKMWMFFVSMTLFQTAAMDNRQNISN